MNQKASDLEQRDQALFDSIAESYTRKDLLPASRLARRLRLTQTLGAIPLTRGARVLEAGCGAGFSADYLRDLNLTLVGVDYSERLIHYANLHNAGERASFMVGNMREFVAESPFEAIFMIGVLHHFDDMSSILSHIVTQLKPGGWLVANEPQPGNPLVRFLRWSRKRIDKGYSDDQAQLSAAQLQQAYAAAGLVNFRSRPQGVFSTPFAEVPMRPQWLAAPLSWCACRADAAIESVAGRLLHSFSWNIIGAGQKPT